jgi:hypothetical protein
MEEGGAFAHYGKKSMPRELEKQPQAKMSVSSS